MWESLSTRSLGPPKIIYLNFPGYFTIAKNTLEKYPRKFISLINLNFPGNFTIAKNTLRKYPEKFKYAICGPPLKPCT